MARRRDGKRLGDTRVLSRTGRSLCQPFDCQRFYRRQMNQLPRTSLSLSIRRSARTVVLYREGQDGIIIRIHETAWEGMEYYNVAIDHENL